MQDRVGDDPALFEHDALRETGAARGVLHHAEIAGANVSLHAIGQLLRRSFRGVSADAFQGPKVVGAGMAATTSVEDDNVAQVWQLGAEEETRPGLVVEL